MASVFIGDLDDFITPSQSCVNPIFAGTAAAAKKPTQEDGSTGRAKVTLEASWMEEAAPLVPLVQEPDLIKARPAAVGGQGAAAAATVSLNDCLACSGCVTSAETVLIAQQSGGEFRRVLARAGPQHAHVKAVALALAPQTLASLAVRLSEHSINPTPNTPTLARIQRCLGAFFRHLAAGASSSSPLPVYIYGTGAASNLSLLEAGAEFVARYRHWQQQDQGQAPAWEAPPPSRALSATRDAAEGEEWGGGAAPVVGGVAAGRPAPPPRHEVLPMLASACPGWVCYAEKTTPQALPYVSTAKSPQQILGTLVKEVLAPASGLAPREVCLVGVMPCYDKKLEASRKDFRHEEWGDAPEVDLVLTTGEILELLLEEHRAGRLGGDGGGDGGEEGEQAALRALWALGGVGEGDAMDVDAGAGTEPQQQGANGAEAWTLASAESALLFSGLDPDDPSTLLAGQVPGGAGGGGSGGFLEFVFRYAARELFGVEVAWDSSLVYQQGRNADFQEAVLELPGQEGGVALRFARAYGFRNIQAVVSRLRRKGKGGGSGGPLHFVEIMACPSGCVNGGGQLKGPSGEPSAAGRERVGAVRHALEAGRRPRPVGESAMTRWVYGPGGVAPEGPLGPGAVRLFHTRYHAVPKLEAANPSVIKW